MNKQIGHILWDKIRVSRKVSPVSTKSGEVTIDIPFKLYEYVDVYVLTERLRRAIHKQLQSKGIPIYVDSDTVVIKTGLDPNNLRWAKYKIYNIEEAQMKAINQWIADTWNKHFARMSRETQIEEMVKWDQSVVKDHIKLIGRWE